MRKSRILATCVVAVAVVALAVMHTGIIQIPSLGSQSYASPVSVSRSSCVRPPGFILIVAGLSGFNDSIGHGAPTHPWPTVHVQKGQIVRFLVCNDDPTQAHGFAITYYFDAGVPIAPGEAYRIVFTATQVGTFTIYCNIFCTIHIYMRGQLIVS
jgi:FtsP/CotA-like multicopper oxidase with cupredoxin domain